MPHYGPGLSLLLLVFLFCCLHAFGQQARPDRFDTAYYKQLYFQPVPGLKEKFDSAHISLGLSDSSLLEGMKPSIKLPRGRIIAPSNGIINYEYQYFSKTDTPYAEQHIGQHLLAAQWGATVGGYIPLQFRLNIRRSNSALFRDFADLQVSFDANAFREQQTSAVIKRIDDLSRRAQDSLRQITQALDQLTGLLKQRQNIREVLSQKMTEAREVINLPKLAYEPGLSDSVNKQRADTLVRKAKAFLDWCERIMGKRDSLQQQYDSLHSIRNVAEAAVQNWKNRAAAAYRRELSPTQLQNLADSAGAGRRKHWRVLDNIRQFGLGRNNLDYSELTARNISITGVNIEYQSWFYAAFAAGVLDYRFRDFYPRQYAKPRQSLVIGRLGVIRPSGNSLLFSAYHGQKQLYSGSATAASYPVTGYSLEGKWRLTSEIQFMAEAAQSFSPDFRTQPLATDYHWKLKDVSNKALFLRLNGYLRKTQSRFDVRYRFTGERFQSFSRLQAFSALKAWSAKWDQGLFRRKLKLSAAAYTNDFSNPYLEQRYTSRSVMRSFQASLFLRHLPVVSIGYLPLSQVTRIDSQWIENHFQVLNATLFHDYRLGRLRASTNIAISKYYNDPGDSALLYYQALNLLVCQSFYFKGVNVLLSLSVNKMPAFNHVVLEEGVNWPVTDRISIDGGVKMNQLNGMPVQMGGYAGGSITIFKEDKISFRFDRDYYPSDTKTLYDRITGTIQLIKSF